MTDPCPLCDSLVNVETAWPVSEDSCMIYYVCSGSRCSYGRVEEEENDSDAERGVTNESTKQT